MKLVKYISTEHPDGAIGVQAGGVIFHCAASIGALLQSPYAYIRTQVDELEHTATPENNARLVCPVDDDTEIWAAGVTYQRSREARIEEAQTADIYSRVYDADRPELFFKSIGWRTVSHLDPINIRRDSELNVPEPELGLVINAHQEVVGLLTANDVSSRSIEGENPLYLPQAKVYSRSCALGLTITPRWDLPNMNDLAIRCCIDRAGDTVWQVETSTQQMHRSFDELVAALFAEMNFPRGVVLLTGTGLVPSLETTLLVGDIVTIDIDGVGELTNPVTTSHSEPSRA